MRTEETLRRVLTFTILYSLFSAFSLSCGGPSELPQGPKVEVTIEPGMSATTVARVLADAEVVDSEIIFRFRCWYEQCDNAIRPGRYRLPKHSSPRAVLRVLTGRAAAYRMVTIPEGLTIWQTASVLSVNGICDSAAFVAACSDTAVLRAARIPYATAEGFLFPETYEFATGTAPARVVERLAGQLRSVLTELSPADTSDRSGVVTLASIVEREARVAEERPVIAGVFRNRLRRGIPLMSCATVEYVLPEHKAALSYDDLRTPSPYNTYLHPGLPPGPICSPGRASLLSALSPARHDYLFFVSNGDGTHTFSRTSAEHDAAVRRVQRGS